MEKNNKEKLEINPKSIGAITESQLEFFKLLFEEIEDEETLLVNINQDFYSRITERLKVKQPTVRTYIRALLEIGFLIPFKDKYFRVNRMCIKIKPQSDERNN